MSILSTRMFLVLASCTLLANCASDVKRVAMPANANANDEIVKVDFDMAQARGQQVDIASPSNWRHAEKALTSAKNLREKAAPQNDILLLVGESKAALNDASAKSTETKRQLFDVMASRDQARAAGVEQYYNREMMATDAELKDLTAEFEAGDGKISGKKRENFQKQYADLELKSIKATYLSRAQAMIESAEKNQASKYAPKSLDMAKAKLQNAEAVISTNRNDKPAIVAVSQGVTLEAEKLVRVTREARAAKGLSAEEVALTIDAKKSEVSALDAALDGSEQRNQGQKNQLQKKNLELIAAAGQNDALKEKEAFNESFTKAQNEFSPEQADVYRQGDNLVIRLKAVNFPSGQSELSGKTFPVLNQVKDLISSLKAGKVVVQGHTDSIGSKEINMKLSQSRASAVATYLTSMNAIESDHIFAEGFGYEKPLATNKTSAGRLQNRRVDVIISPVKAE